MSSSSKRKRGARITSVAQILIEQPYHTILDQTEIFARKHFLRFQCVSVIKWQTTRIRDNSSSKTFFLALPPSPLFLSSPPPPPPPRTNIPLFDPLSTEPPPFYFSPPPPRPTTPPKKSPSLPLQSLSSNSLFRPPPPHPPPHTHLSPPSLGLTQKAFGSNEAAFRIKQEHLSSTLTERKTYGR